MKKWSFLVFFLIPSLFLFLPQKIQAQDIPVVTLPPPPSPPPETTTIPDEKPEKTKKEKVKKKPESEKKKVQAEQSAQPSTAKPKKTKSISNGPGSFKSTKSIALNLTGNIEFSTLNKLHDLANQNMGTISTLGWGGNVSFAFGISQRFRLAIDAGYSRLTYSDKFKPIIARSYFIFDFQGHYLLTTKSNKNLPFIVFGVGGELSLSGGIPLAEFGVGNEVRLSEKIFIVPQLVYKTGFVHHRIEPSLGVNLRF